jgi:hypothetical protein
MSHPRITFSSSRRASDFNLFLAFVVSLGMDLFSYNGCEHVSKALGGGRDRIGQDYLSPLCPLSRRWGGQCNCWLCLVDQYWCQQWTWCHPWVGLNHQEIFDREQDVGFYQTASWDPICCYRGGEVADGPWNHAPFIGAGGSTKGEAGAHQHQYTTHHSQTTNRCNSQCPPKIISFYADLNVTNTVGKPPFFAWSDW